MQKKQTKKLHYFFKSFFLLCFVFSLFLCCGKTILADDPLLPTGSGWSDFKDITSSADSASGEGIDRGTSGIYSLVYYAYDIIRQLLGFAALFLGAMAAVKFIQARGNEDKITEAKNWFMWAGVGFIIFSIALPIKDVFLVTGEDLFLSGENVRESSNSLFGLFEMLIKLGRYFLGAFAVYFIVASGTKLVIFAYDEETIEQQKKVFTWGIIGLILFMIAPELVQIFYGGRDASGLLVQPSVEQSNETMLALTNFLLYFIGPISLLVLTIASLMYVLPTSEETKEKGKKMIITTVMVIVLSYSSWVIVNEIVRITSSTT